MVKTTTIQVSTELKKELSDRKLFDGESYEDVIWDLIEDTMELSEEAKRDIKEAEEDIRKGRVYPLEEVKKELKIDV
jgi:predicted transcriptional regulator